MLDVTYTFDNTAIGFFVKLINPSLGPRKSFVPSSIVFIILSPETVPPLQLTAPADRFGSERIHVDGWRNVNKAGSGGDKAQGPLRAADLSAGAGLGGLGQQALQGRREATKYTHRGCFKVESSSVRWLTHLWRAGRVAEPQFPPRSVRYGAGARWGEGHGAASTAVALHPRCPAGWLRAQNPGPWNSGTADPEGVVIWTVVAAAAAPIFPTAREIQLLTDPIKCSCHDWGLTFSRGSILKAGNSCCVLYLSRGDGSNNQI